MKPDLSKYPHFNGPIENFSLLPIQGFCNENYSFTMYDQKYLLRKFKDKSIDRKFEFKIQHLAYEQQIAGKPIVLDEEQELMICEFIEGHHKEVLERDELQRLAKLVKTLHSIKVDAKIINLQDEFHEKPQEILHAFEVLESFSTQNVLCHNDLNPKNILFSHDIKVIDWEYASINDRYFDLASISVEFNLSEHDEVFFLGAYMGGDEEIHLEKLHAYKTIYSVLCKQWFDNLAVK